MKYCTKCGNELMDEAVFCPKCGCSVNDNGNVKKEGISFEGINPGLCVLSAVIPIAGIVLWIVKNKEKPKHAPIYGAIGLVAWVVWMAIFVSPNILHNILKWI